MGWCGSETEGGFWREGAEEEPLRREAPLEPLALRLNSCVGVRNPNFDLFLSLSDYERMTLAMAKLFFREGRMVKKG
jgi:hypothetical protein